MEHVRNYNMNWLTTPSVFVLNRCRRNDNIKLEFIFRFVTNCDKVMMEARKAVQNLATVRSSLTSPAERGITSDSRTIFSLDQNKCFRFHVKYCLSVSSNAVRKTSVEISIRYIQRLQQSF